MTDRSGLVSLLDRLGQRVRSGRGKLVENLPQTRYSLIDPLLVALGWDLSDQEQVVHEPNGAGLSLRHQGIPCLDVRCSELGANLFSPGGDFDSDVPYLLATNGENWRLYATHRLRACDEPEIVLEFSVVETPPGHAAEQADCLRPYQIGEGSPSDHDPVPRFLEALWNWTDGEGAEIKLPRALIAPECRQGPLTKWKRIEARTWAGLTASTAQWLADQGKLSAADCPIRWDNAWFRCLVHAEPVHSDGSRFSQAKAVKTGDGFLWVETKYDKRHHLLSVETLLRRVGEDPWSYGLDCQFGG